MKKNRHEKKNSFRTFRSYITLTISISLVLFLVGLISLLLLNSNRLSDFAQEHVGFTAVLSDQAQESDALRLQKMLSATDYVKASEYIDKEQAATDLKASIGEDFVDFLGYNPLFSSLKLKIKSDYMTEDSLAVIESKLLKYPDIDQVYYQKNLINVINNNVHKLSMLLFSITILLILIFAALINNMVRISMYNQRFIINTMKLVGATRSFIRKPFIRRSILAGVFGALLANLFLLTILSSFQNSMDIAFRLSTLDSIIITLGIILIFGVLISAISTYFALNKYLRMKYEELF